MTALRKGDAVVELRRAVRVGQQDEVGQPLTVAGVTQTLVIASNGERYRRSDLKPISEGRLSDRVLVPAGDDRVLIARGREKLRGLAATATNLVGVDYAAPADVMAALAQVVVAAQMRRKELGLLMAEATRRAQGGSDGDRR